MNLKETSSEIRESERSQRDVYRHCFPISV